MRTRLYVGLAAVVMGIAACGGGDVIPTIPVGSADPGATNPSQTDPGASGATGPGGQSDAVTPEASGPLAPNTIRIGDQIWERTLPMTTGQCFLYEDDGTLPTSATVWGTVDNDEDIRFSASFKQDGTFEAELSNNLNMYWGSGPRFEEEDLVVELDFENLVISGHGTFRSLTTGERAMGSFEFICEPEDQ